MLQAVYCARDQLTKKQVAGHFGDKTKALLAADLGLKEGTTFDKSVPLSKETLTKVA